MWEKKYAWWKWQRKKTFRYNMDQDTGYAEINAVLDGGDLSVTIRPKATDNPHDDLLKVYIGITRTICKMAGMTPAKYTEAVHTIFTNEEKFLPVFTYGNGEGLFEISEGGYVHKEVGGKRYPLYDETPKKPEKEEKAKKEEPPKVYRDRTGSRYKVLKCDYGEIEKLKARGIESDTGDIFAVFEKWAGDTVWHDTYCLNDSAFGIYKSAEEAQLELDTYAVKQGWEVCSRGQ